MNLRTPEKKCLQWKSPTSESIELVFTPAIFHLKEFKYSLKWDTSGNCYLNKGITLLQR